MDSLREERQRAASLQSASLQYGERHAAFPRKRECGSHAEPAASEPLPGAGAQAGYWMSQVTGAGGDRAPLLGGP
jgi:hypothetical protein